MRIVVRRGGQLFGPYAPTIAALYLTQGKLLAHDEARDADDVQSQWTSLEKLLLDGGYWKPDGIGKAFSKTLGDLRSFDRKLVFPVQEVITLRWIQDRKLLNLALVGLAPAALLAVTLGSGLEYWVIAFYFSALWATFFYYLLRTSQTRFVICLLCFFFTGIIAIPLLLVAGMFLFSALDQLTESTNLLFVWFAMFLGVGIPEEVCKAVIVFFVASHRGLLLMPQTVVLYGMISGLGFGIYEGVSYQQGVNREYGTDVAYFLNVARLTSLPFLHATWTGIASYFIAFAVLVPTKRHGLWVIAIAIPAALHATYNTFGWGLIGLGTGLLSVIILMTYLSHSNCMLANLQAQKV